MYVYIYILEPRQIPKQVTQSVDPTRVFLVVPVMFSPKVIKETQPTICPQKIGTPPVTEAKRFMATGQRSWRSFS